MSIQTQPKIRVGDRVAFDWVFNHLVGIVVEITAPILPGKKRLIRVSVPNDPYEEETYPITIDDISAVGDEIPTPEAITNAEAFDYIQNSLLSIIYAGYDEHRYARVWLKREHGNGFLTHTYVPDRGMLGGGGVPYDVLWNNKLKQSRLDEVRTFLKSFQLAHEQVESIIHKIGISKKK